MNSKFTFKEIRDRFIEIEKKYKVYNLKNQNVYIWKLIRFELFDYIVKELNILKDGHPINNIDKFKRLMLLFKYSLLNIFRRKKMKKSDVLILTHGRKQKFKNGYIDIYLNDIISSLRENQKKAFVIDRPDHYGRHYNANYENMIFFERFGHITRECLYKFYSSQIHLGETTQILLDIQKELERVFDIDIDLIGLARKRIFRFNFEKKYFDKILDIVKPQKIFLVASYGKEELIASAQERLIPVVEVQHGVISSYHMGYYFPFKTSIPYFPDEIILFGEYWRESVAFPCNGKQVVRSFNFMNKNESMNIQVKKSEKVLFISQGSIGDQLSKVAAEFANKNYVKCYYKLHPSEYNNWKNKYHELEECAHEGRVEVISNDRSIYELFNLCDYSIGVYSTAIYESLMYENKTYLIAIEGYQYMEYLIDNNHVKLLPLKFSINDLRSFNNKQIFNKSYFYL